MRTKAANIACSTALLLAALAVTGFLIGVVGHSESPSNDPWYWFPEFYLPLILLSSAPWFAARFWYGLPVFFGYGAFLVFPAALGIFVPQWHRGYIVAPVPYCVPEILAFCCVGGLLAAYIGLQSRHRPATSTAL